MGFWASLLGTGTNGAGDDPNPGIGGYTDGTRIDGTPPGYPGSTSANRINPSEAEKETRDGLPFETIEDEQVHRQDQPGEWHGGLPFGGSLSATSVGPQYTDTEHRPNPNTISTGIPGGQRQRNTVYQGGLKAQPGLPSPTGGVNRYVFGGINGGTDILRNITTRRRMPYTGHGTTRGTRSLRGAVLDGQRFNSAPPILQAQGDGYGRSRRHQRHRPTVFAEPAPWAAQFYDTTAATGSPAQPGTPGVITNVYVSPAPPRRTGAERRRSGAAGVAQAGTRSPGTAAARRSSGGRRRG
jgi:hypothetical protein